jgi:hypothetical protein
MTGGGELARAHPHRNRIERRRKKAPSTFITGIEQSCYRNIITHQQSGFNPTEKLHGPVIFVPRNRGGKK